MRLSADPQSPYYVPASYVYLQGQLLDKVLFADEEKGRVILCCVDEHGHVRHKDGEVLTEVRRGHVKIVPRIR